MNTKRFLLATVALFLFIFGYEAFVHGVLLKNIYSQTPSIWRSTDQMLAYAPFNVGIMVLLSVWIVFIFIRLFKEGGWQNGVKFGVYFGVLSAIQAAGAWYYLPISALLAGCWFVAYVLESIIGGLVIGLIYHHK